MGKRTRRKRQGNAASRRVGAHHRGDGVNANDITSGINHQNNSKSRAVLQRIRHGDPRVRDGALSALATTVFSSAGCDDEDDEGDGRDGRGKNDVDVTIVTDELLRAIAERISVDRDVPSARAAAGCLLNYAASSDRHCRRLLRGLSHVDVTAALLGRVSRVLRIYNACDVGAMGDGVSPPATPSSSSSKKKKGKRGNPQQNAESGGRNNATNQKTNEWKRSFSEWQVTAQCLSVLCTLLESTEGASCAEKLSTTTTTTTTTATQPSSTRHQQQSHSLEVIVHALATAYVLLTQPPPYFLPHRGDVAAASSSADNATATAEWRNLLNSSLASSLDSSTRILHGIVLEQEEEEEAGGGGGLADLILRMSVEVHAPPQGGRETTSMVDGAEEEEAGNGVISGFVDLLSTVASDGRVPARARLHAAGTLCVARHHTVSSSNRAPPSGADGEDAVAVVEEPLERAIERSVLPLLSSYVDGYDPRLTSAMAHRVYSARSAVEEERIDAMTEAGVEKIVRDRNEPARHIARRLMVKDSKHEAEPKEKDKRNEVNSEDDGKNRDDGGDEHSERKGGDDVPMMETDDDDGVTDGKRGDPDPKISGSAPGSEEEHLLSNSNDEKRDVKGSYDRAVDAWERSILPLKLALEVAANLSAGSGGGDSNGPVVDNDMAMRDENEVNEEEGEEEEWGEVRPAPRDVDLFCSISRSGLPEGIFKLLRVLCDPLPRPPTSTPTSTGTTGDGGNTRAAGPVLDQADTASAAAVADTSNHAIVPLPHMVASDLAELRSKCGACLGNLLGVLSSPPSPSSRCTWRMDAGGTVELWRSLVSSLAFSAADDTGDGGGSIAGAMAVLIRNRHRRSLLLPQVGERDLSLLLRMTKPDGGSGGGERASTGAVPPPSREDSLAAATEEVRQNAIVCLNALCSEPHSADVNDAVCVALLNCVRDDPSVSVVGEALNALMDIYGDDDDLDGNGYKRDVFLARGVLEEFRGALDSFHRRIPKKMQQEGQDGDAFGTWDDVVVEQLEEIALNASRFIEYKEEQLGCGNDE